MSLSTMLPSLSPHVAASMLNSTMNTTEGPSIPVGIDYGVGVAVEFVIFLLITGNLLMIITLLLYKPWSTTDLLLCSLSSADFINGLIPLQILNVHNSFVGRNRWTAELCGLFIWMTFTLRLASVLTITLISAERMLMLARPLQHHTIVTVKKARIAVLVTWSVSAFISALPFMGAGKSGFSAGGYCYYQLYDLGIAFGAVVETIGIIQLVLVLLCFIGIKLSSWKFIQRQSTMAASNMTGANNQRKGGATAGTKQVQQLALMMAIVVILYYLSWLPYLMMNLVSLAKGRLPHGLEIAVGLLSLVSALLNPILYGKMSLRYRKGYIYIIKKAVSLCGGQKPDGAFFDGSRRGSLALSSTYSLAAKRGSCASVLDGISGQHSNAGYDQDEESQLAANTTTTTHVAFTENETRKVDEDANNDSDDDDDGIGIYPVNSVGDNGVDVNPGEMEEDEILIYPFEEHETGTENKDAGNGADLKTGTEQQKNDQCTSSTNSPDRGQTCDTQGVPDEMRLEEDKVLGSSYDNLGREALNDKYEDKATSKGDNSMSEGLAKDHVDYSKEGMALQKSCAEGHNNPIDGQKVMINSEDESAIRMLDELFAGLEDDDDEEDHDDDEQNTEMKEVDDANESCTEHDDSSDDDDVSDDERKGNGLGKEHDESSDEERKGKEIGMEQDDESEDDDEENSEDSDEETEEENSEDSDEVDAENDSSDHQNDDLQLSSNDNKVDEIANKIWEEIWDDTRHDIGERIKCEKPQDDELVKTHQENQKVNMAVKDRSDDAGHVSNAYKDENMNAVAKSRKLSTTAVAREMGNI